MASDPKLVYLKIITHLDYLQNIFFAERLLLRHGHLDDGDLLVTSFEMVILTLKLWIHKDRFSDLSMLRNYEWLVSGLHSPHNHTLLTMILPGHGLRSPRRRYSLSGAIVSHLQRNASQTCRTHAVEYRPTAEFVNWLPRLGATLCTERSVMR